MTTDQIVKEVKPKMDTVLARLVEDLKKIRTGRANPGILDDIVVSYYGTKTLLREMASITVPEPTQIAIKPWDRNALSDIELAIRNSNLGLAPINDGTLVRINLPPMTEERRKEFVGQVKKMAEESKISLRTVRGEVWEKVQSALKNKEITEDDKYGAEEELNKIVAEKNRKIDEIVAEKEKEVMKI